MTGPVTVTAQRASRSRELSGKPLPGTGRPPLTRLRVIGTEAEQLNGVIYGRESSLGGDPFRPLLDNAALDFDAPAADTAGEVVVVRGGLALPV